MPTTGWSQAISWPRTRLSTVRLKAFRQSNHQKSNLYITGPLSHYVLASLHLPAPAQVRAHTTTTAQVAPWSRLRVPPKRRLRPERNLSANAALADRFCKGDRQLQFAGASGRKLIRRRLLPGGLRSSCLCAGLAGIGSWNWPTELREPFSVPATPKSLRPYPSVNKPISATTARSSAILPASRSTRSYVQNNLTESAFLQIRLNARSKAGGAPRVWSTPRSLLVLTPLQYSVNIDTPYLFFPFSAGQVPSGELTVQLPRVSGWNERAGFREEFGSNRPKSFFMNGSYFETGMEFSTQNGNLSSITLQTIPDDRSASAKNLLRQFQHHAAIVLSAPPLPARLRRRSPSTAPPQSSARRP